MEDWSNGRTEEWNVGIMENIKRWNSGMME
jgi:hypothetical protein